MIIQIYKASYLPRSN